MRFEVLLSYYSFFCEIKYEKQFVHQTKDPLALGEWARKKKVTTNCIITICLMLAG